MIQFTRDGVKAVITADAMRAARETFERDKLLRLPELIGPDLADVVREGMERDGFQQPDEATMKSVYGGWYGPVRQDLNPGPTIKLLDSRVNDPVFLRFVQELAGTPPLARCVGRVFRLRATDEDHVWHTDAEGGRLADIVIDLSADRYEGGAFEMRDAATKQIFTVVDDMQYREGALARIAAAIEHHNRKVTSSTQRITYVGWFVPEGHA